MTDIILTAAQKTALAAELAKPGNTTLSFVTKAVVVPPPPPPPPPPTGLTLIAGMTDVTAEATLARPVRGTPVVEPHWGPTIQVAAQLSDVPTDPNGGHPGWIRNDYSRHQPFNCNSTLYFVQVSSGFWALYRASDHSFVQWIAHLAGDAEPQWDATNPNKLYYLAIDGSSMQLYSQDVTNGTQVVEGDMVAPIRALFPTAHYAYTKAEGSPSKDCRYWAFIVADASYNCVGFIVWDNAAKAIVSHMAGTGNNPDHVSMTPDGNYVVPSWDSAEGTRAYKRDFSAFTQVHHKSEHSDLVTLANGHQAYISLDYQSNSGDVFWVDITAQTFDGAAATRNVLFPTYYNPLTGQGGATGSFHFSGKAYAKPGWVLLGCYGDGADRSVPPQFQWFHKRLFAVNLNVSPAKVLTIATTHSSGAGGYTAETHACPNLDFTQLHFNSNWNVTTDAAIAPFAIVLPSSAIA